MFYRSTAPTLLRSPYRLHPPGASAYRKKSGHDKLPLVHGVDISIVRERDGEVRQSALPLIVKL